MWLPSPEVGPLCWNASAWATVLHTFHIGLTECLANCCKLPYLTLSPCCQAHKAYHFFSIFWKSCWGLALSEHKSITCWLHPDAGSWIRRLGLRKYKINQVLAQGIHAERSKWPGWWWQERNREVNSIVPFLLLASGRHLQEPGLGHLHQQHLQQSCVPWWFTNKWAFANCFAGLWLLWLHISITETESQCKAVARKSEECLDCFS